MTGIKVVLFVSDIRIAILVTFVSALTEIAKKSILFNDDSIGGIATKFVLMAVMISLVILVMAYIVNHVSQLQTRLLIQVNEYFSLINRMREGVIVFTQESESTIIRFCNKSAEKIFGKYHENEENLDESCMKTAIF